VRAWRERAGARAAVRAVAAAATLVAVAATLVAPALRGGWMRWRARSVECALAVRRRRSCRAALLARG